MATSAITSGGLRNDFLLLLTEQLKHQDPLEPTKQDEFIGQLAQFTTLEKMEAMNTRMEELLSVSKQQLEQSRPIDTANLNDLTQSALLLGRKVEYAAVKNPSSPGAALQSTTKEGIVESVTLRDGKIYLTVNDDEITYADVTTIVADIPELPAAPAPLRMS